MTAPPVDHTPYRGRLAPSPTGYLHLGHARTFWIAQQRARLHHGTLILRNEDLDPDRCRGAFVQSMFTDLHWFGLRWTEGPDIGGPHGPYSQSERSDLYQAAFRQLLAAGFLYPCRCSRKDIRNALRAPHAADDEPIYPGTCRPSLPVTHPPPAAGRINWRFRVPHHQLIQFTDLNLGPQTFVGGEHFGDFVVWRHDNVPSYQLAVVVDDAAMRVTEVVRGADLLVSTARQILLFQALGRPVPEYFHCALLTDDAGRRLAKRHDALSLRQLQSQNVDPESLRKGWDTP